MHKLTKIIPFIRKKIWYKYNKKMKKTKWKWKKLFYIELSSFYRVNYNTIRKVIKRAKTLASFIKRAYKKKYEKLLEKQLVYL